MFRSFLTLGVFFLVGLESVSAQLLINNFSDTTNNRFVDDPSFIGADYDFSGVARTTDNGRWGTLISPNAVLTAQHFRPSLGSTFEFYPGNDPNSTPFEAIVTSSIRVGSTDLSIVILDRNVDPSIAVYNFATDEYEGDPPITTTNVDGSTSTQTFFNTDPNEVNIVGERTLVFGRAQGTSLDSPTSQAVGENLVFSFSENVVFGSNADNDSIILQRDAEGTPNALTHESYVRGGDSGAPTFLIDSTTNELVLLGVNSFQLDAADPNVFQSSGVTYTGNQMDDITSILNANVIVPALLGDCNFDGEVNFLDISPFIAVLSMNDFLEEADIDENGFVNFLDISLFINLLSN